MKLFYTTKEVAEMLGTSNRTASNRIRKINDELQSQGFWVESGKVPINLFHEKYPYIEKKIDEEVE